MHMFCQACLIHDTSLHAHMMDPCVRNVYIKEKIRHVHYMVTCLDLMRATNMTYVCYFLT
jgi:hypothetical protein